uniref:non-specific serine/threonine protein kinase n=1 Tax=Cyprinus carpio carpio TaxID=630221 RepID=A0A8C1BJ74_CYPCA
MKKKFKKIKRVWKALFGNSRASEKYNQKTSSAEGEKNDEGYDAAVVHSRRNTENQITNVQGQATARTELDLNGDALKAPVQQCAFDVNGGKVGRKKEKCKKKKSFWKVLFVCIRPSKKVLQAPVRAESNWSVDAHQAPVCTESDWSVDAFQAAVQTESDWSFDALQAPVRVESDWSVDALQAPVRAESDWSVDALQAPVRTESDCSVDALQAPVRIESDWSVDALQAPVRTESDCSVDALQAPVRVESDWSVDALQAPDRAESDWSVDALQAPVRVESDWSVDALQAPVCAESDWSVDALQAPVRAESDWSVDALQAPVCTESDWSVDALQTPFHVEPDWSFDALQAPVCAESDWSVDALQAPVRVESDWSVDALQAPVRTESDWSVDALQAPVRVESDCSVDALQAPVRVESDWSVDALQAPVRTESDWSVNALQAPVRTESDCSVDAPVRAKSAWSVDALQTSGNTNSLFDPCSDIFSYYEVGNMLGQGGFGAVYEGRRVMDGLEVAVKFVKKSEDTKYINFTEPLPLEVALLILANEGPRVPHIIQLLDWKDVGEYYIMVLERPVPCEDLLDFVQRHGGRIDEVLARVIMRQATQAAYMSCQRGVLHRDIKQENLLINKDTLEVKLIDFGCGDLLQTMAYTTFMGTRMYCPPEFLSQGKYHGEPATVYSLGVLLFSLICGTFPDSHDKIMIDLNRWFIAGLSQECCQLICSCLQRDPKKRLDLGKILHHKWFKGINMKKTVI